MKNIQTKENENKLKDILIRLILNVWNERKTVFWICGMGVILGVIVAYTTPEEWSAESKLFVQNSGSSQVSGTVGTLAKAAGINIAGERIKGLGPAAYQEILQDDSFIKDLLSQNFYFIEINDSIRFENYMNEYLKDPPVRFLRKKVRGIFRSKENSNQSIGSGRDTSDEYLFLTRRQLGTISRTRMRLTAEFDDLAGLLILNFELQDPFLAAQVSSYTSNYLEEYVNKYEFIGKQNKVNFIESQLAEKKVLFEEKQSELAIFLDRNSIISTNVAKTQEEKLRAEFNVAFQVYSSLAQALEQAKIELEENSPKLTRLGKMTIPIVPSDPNRKIIIAAFVFLSVFLSVSFVLFKGYVTTLWNELRNAPTHIREG